MDLIFVKETPSELFWRSRHLITRNNRHVDDLGKQLFRSACCNT